MIDYSMTIACRYMYEAFSRYGWLYPVDANGFFFKATTSTDIYTLSLHDALPISYPEESLKNGISGKVIVDILVDEYGKVPEADRKSTRLNSSHSQISYAVFCLKKKMMVVAF